MDTHTDIFRSDGVIWHTAISLDGFAADVNDSLMFMMGEEAGPPPDNPLVDMVMTNVGCTLGGRRGYDLCQGWDEIPKASLATGARHALLAVGDDVQPPDPLELGVHDPELQSREALQVIGGRWFEGDQQVLPPSTTRVCPVVQAPAREAR